jgi:hypothetical protein
MFIKYICVYCEFMLFAKNSMFTIIVDYILLNDKSVFFIIKDFFMTIKNCSDYNNNNNADTNIIRYLKRQIFVASERSSLISDIVKFSANIIGELFFVYQSPMNNYFDIYLFHCLGSCQSLAIPQTEV